ncbi:MAG: response regulator [Firmicutes bacterium]|nr:response regulator [Bacillota bacterium]
MEIFIVEDDLSIVQMLENIIEDNNLGHCVGYSLNGEDALEKIEKNNPDIVLIDLLMPKKDGIEVVTEIKSKNIKSKFIMISQVSQKELIGKSYYSGVEFFINKPINIIEVISVIKNVSSKIKMENSFNNLRDVFESLDDNNKSKKRMKKVRLIISKLGLLGESGGDYIIEICKYLIDNDEKYFNYKISEICSKLSDNPKAMEQSLRRAINKALVNVANIGIEDYLNDNFINYSNSLFDFENVKAEMDRIRGKRSTGGKISVRKFINGILLYSEI